MFNCCPRKVEKNYWKNEQINTQNCGNGISHFTQAQKSSLYNPSQNNQDKNSPVREQTGKNNNISYAGQPKNSIQAKRSQHDKQHQETYAQQQQVKKIFKQQQPKTINKKEQGEQQSNNFQQFPQINRPSQKIQLEEKKQNQESDVEMIAMVKQSSQNLNKPFSNERTFVCKGDIQKIISGVQEKSEINQIPKQQYSADDSKLYDQFQIEERRTASKAGRRVYTAKQPDQQRIIVLNEKPRFKYMILAFKKEMNITRIDIFYFTDPSQGKLYRSEFDELNKNPTYCITEGSYNINDPYNIKILQKTCEYLGKSNNVKPKKQEPLIALEPTVKKRIKIFDTDGTLLNNKPLQKVTPIETWIKFNQQITDKDIQILKSRDWLTSSIIDAYALYLNLENSKSYFLKPVSQRMQIKRLIIVESSLFTSFYFKTRQFEYQKEHKQIFQKEFLEFQEIQFKVWEIYQQMAFIINQNNYHWFLILIDFQELEIVSYDSLQSSNHDKYFEYFSTFFTQLGFTEKMNSKEIRDYKFSQNNGYACGHRTCSFMKFLSDKQFYPNEVYEYNEQTIKNDLMKILSK